MARLQSMEVPRRCHMPSTTVLLPMWQCCIPGMYGGHGPCGLSHICKAAHKVGPGKLCDELEDNSSCQNQLVELPQAPRESVRI